MTFHYRNPSRAVFDLVSVPLKGPGAGDDVLVIRDGTLKVERRGTEKPVLRDGKYWARAELRETREPSPDDLVSFQIKSIEGVVERLQRVFEVGAPTLIRAHASGEERLTPKDLGPADGIELSLDPSGGALRFAIPALSFSEVVRLQKKLEVVSQLLMPQLVDHGVQLLGGSSAVRFKLNMAFGELLPNALGHNLLGIRVSKIPKPPAVIKGDVLESLLQCPPGEVVLTLHIAPHSSEAPRAITITIDQPRTFRFLPLKGSSGQAPEGRQEALSGAEAFDAWWEKAEEVTEDPFLENPSGRGAIILRDLLKLQGEFDPATNRLTFRTTVDELVP
jgi:hypothetical protein